MPKKFYKVASEIFLKNFYAMIPLFEHVCVQKCFMDYYHANTKRFLQMPRPLCNFLHVYFLKIQVCNKTICVKKNRRKEEVFTNLLLAIIYSNELIFSKPPINAQAWCNSRWFLFCTSCRCTKHLLMGETGHCTDTSVVIL